MSNILFFSYNLINNHYFISVLYLVGVISFILYYLDNFNLSKYFIIKFIQIFSFFSIFIILFIFTHSILLSSDIIFWINDNNSKNNIHLHGHVSLDKESAKAIGKSIGSNIGLAGIVAGVSGAVAKGISKSSMPPIQKTGLIVGGAAAGGLVWAGINNMNRWFDSSYTSNSIPSATSNANNININKLMAYSDSNPLQDSFFIIENINYVCLGIIYILLIQLVYKLYFKNTITLGLDKILGNKINKKIEFYLNKIIQLNKQMSTVWIWYGFATLIFCLSFNAYFINFISVNLDRGINMYNSVNNNIMPTAYKSIQDALFYIMITNYISLAITICLIFILWSRFNAKEYIKSNLSWYLGIYVNNKLEYLINKIILFIKKKGTAYLWILFISLIIFIALCTYTVDELYTNIQSYVNIYNNIEINNKKMTILPILPFSSFKVCSSKRIGPHNYEILCILIGSLLGDGSMERDGKGSRFCFYQKGEHIEYVLWLHQQLLKNGYCKENIPQIQSRIINNKLAYYCRFRSFTYSSFNWIHEGFYRKGKKSIPCWIEQYLSPISLAIWIMDDGAWIKNRGIKLCTNSFSLSDVKKLVYILETRYKLKLAIHSAGSLNQYNIYIPKVNLPILIPLISPYLHPYFLYKLNMVKINLS